MTEAAVLVFFCFSLLHGYVEALNCTSPTPKSLMNALEMELSSKKLLRPVKNSTDTLNIKIHMTLVGILGVEEKAQSLTTFIWQVLEWKIDGLSWDEKECGTKKISLPREKLWTPDIHIREFMDEDKSPKTPYIYLYNTGYVYDDKPVRVVSFCHLDIYTFPFDVQNCTLTFGSYLHFIEDIRTYQGSTPQAILNESRNVIQTNGEWELADVQANPYILNIEDGRYSYIKFHLILRRRPILYVVNLLIPSCFLSTLDLFSFLLPPQSVDRSAFKMTLILGYTVFLLIMNDLLPVTGNSTPIMNVLFSVSLALMVGSLLETVFITNIQFSSYKYGEAPRWLSVLVLQYLAVVVCFPTKKKTNRVTVSFQQPNAVMNANVISTRHLLSTDTPSDPTLDELRKLSRDLMNIRFHIDKYFLGTKSSQEWQMIALVIDRFLFGIYILFMTVSFITFIAIWIWTKSYVR